jgi:hypothetical protein
VKIEKFEEFLRKKIDDPSSEDKKLKESVYAIYSPSRTVVKREEKKRGSSGKKSSVTKSFTKDYLQAVYNESANKIGILSPNTGAWS